MKMINSNELTSFVKELPIKDEYLEFAVPKLIDALPSIEAVPLSEIESLRKEMNTIRITTDAQGVLWTCVSMLEDLIEQYKGENNATYTCKQG